MLSGERAGGTQVSRIADAGARAATTALCFLAAVGSAIGPVVWVAGTLNGDEVSVEGGSLRVAAQVVLAATFARIASRRSRDLPVIGARPGH